MLRVFSYPFIPFSPDGKKKAYVRLTSDHDALDVANKVRPSGGGAIMFRMLRHSTFPSQIGFI